MLAQAATDTIKICGVTVHNFQECLADRGTRRPTEGSLIPHYMPQACNSELPGNLKIRIPSSNKFTAEKLQLLLSLRMRLTTPEDASLYDCLSVKLLLVICVFWLLLS